MRFRFDSAPSASGLSLPVLPEIPDGSIIWVEGRNGIGKTLSVRLLDLATGGAPYASDPEAWRSLQSGTGVITISASNGDELLFWLDPEGWADDPTRQTWDQLGTATIGGEPATREQIIERLRVVRIAGEEGLARAIGSQFVDLAAKVDELADRLGLRADAADTSVDALLRLLERAASERAESAAAELAEAERSLQQADAALDPVSRRLRLLDQAIHAADSLEALTSRGPELIAKIEGIGQELQDAHRRREDAVAELTATAASRPGSSATNELARIEKLVARREKAADKVALEVSQLAGVAKTAPDRALVAGARAQIVGDLETETARRGDLARSDAVRTFLTRLLHLLDDSAELEGRAVVLEMSGQPVTREILQDAAQARRSSLDQTDIAREVDATDERLRDLVERQEALDAVADALGRLAHKRDSVRKALAQLARLESGLEGAKDRFRAARERLDSAVQDAERLTLAKQEAERALAALAEGATDEELRDSIAAAEVPVEELIPTRDALRQEAGGLGRVREEAKRAVDAYRLAAAEALAEQEQSREALADEPEWAWFRSAVGVGDWSAAWTAQVRRAASEAREAVNAAARNTKGVADALRDIAAHVSDARALPPETPISRAVIAACEDRVRAEFMSEAIRAALFDGAVVEAVDLRNPSVAWDDDGLRVIRPFSAFSSGEQAFAYIRARIEQVRKRADEHLLLVLDEFSAFIAGDRRRLLNRLLAERIHAQAVSQVVLIVPLSQDYVTAAAEAGDDASPVLVRRAAEVERVGYFAEQAPS